MNTAAGNSEYSFRVILIGDSAVGKSNLMLRFTKNKFDPMSKTTVGVDFDQRVIHIDGKLIRVHVWNTTGSERYCALISSYYRNSNGVLLVYDITDHSSYENLEKWYRELSEPNDQKVVMLVGNKSDLKDFRTVPADTARKFAEKNGFLFMETSALDSSNVEAAFQNLLTEIHRKVSAKSNNEISEQGTTVNQSVEPTIKDLPEVDATSEENTEPSVRDISEKNSTSTDSAN